MAINRGGFVKTSNGLEVVKDTEGQLTYTFDWTDWLESGDTIDTVTYTVAARRNDPTPLTIESSGITGSDKKTYVEISGGAKGKVYIITSKVETSDGIIDRRNFRMKVEDRTA